MQKRRRQKRKQARELSPKLLELKENENLGEIFCDD